MNNGNRTDFIPGGGGYSHEMIGQNPNFIRVQLGASYDWPDSRVLLNTKKKVKTGKNSEYLQVWLKKSFMVSLCLWFVLKEVIPR